MIGNEWSLSMVRRDPECAWERSHPLTLSVVDSKQETLSIRLIIDEFLAGYGGKVLHLSSVPVVLSPFKGGLQGHKPGNRSRESEREVI